MTRHRACGPIAAAFALVLLVLSAPALPGAEPLRIVTLTPHTAELVDAAGGSSFLVGVAAFTDEPSSAAKLPQVSDAFSVDRELLLSLRPNLVIAWQGGNREADIAWLENRGILVFRSDPRSLMDIAREIRQLGHLMNTPDIAGDRASQVTEQIEQLGEAYGHRNPVRYFFQLWHRPPMTLGRDALLTRALARCRAENVFGEVPGKSFSLDPESPSQTAVEVEIIATDLGEVPPLTRAPHIVRADTDGLYRPSPRLLKRLHQLCKDLHRTASKG